ncbi:hypothetical protein M3607_04940 [Metabacillus litoralis]|nr:hypothetical protein [Metabacillus litoralis]
MEVMILSVFIQYSHISVINSFKIDNKDFTVIDIGVRLFDEENFTYNFIETSFCFPLFFVLSTTMLDDEELDKVKQHEIEFLASNNWIIVKVLTKVQLRLISGYCEWFACIGLGSYMIQGENIHFEELWPVVHWSIPTKFPNLDWGKVNTLINIEEVGHTVITKDERINSTVKLKGYIPKEYGIDLENSDF